MVILPSGYYKVIGSGKHIYWIELTDAEVKEIVIKGCSQGHKDSVAQSLSAGTKVLSEHIRNDITSASDSNCKRKFERFTSINDCNEVDGTITNSIAETAPKIGLVA